MSLNVMNKLVFVNMPVVQQQPQRPQGSSYMNWTCLIYFDCVLCVDCSWVVLRTCSVVLESLGVCVSVVTLATMQA